MIAGLTYYEICFYFVIYSFLGWCVEVVYHAVTLGKVVNRGFLNGPVCPVYGFGSLAVFALGNCISDEGTETLPVWLLFIMGVLLATAVELIAGWLLDMLFHARWWDYSSKPFNFHGYICLEFSLIWGLGIVFIVRIVHPAMDDVSVNLVPKDIGWPLIAVIYALYLADLIVTVSVVRGLNRRLAKLDEIRSSMRLVSDKLSELLGEETFRAEQRIQEGKEQAALGKAALRDAAGQKRRELEEKKEQLHRRAAELQAQADQLRASIVGESIFGGARILRAFPDLLHREYPELVHKLRDELKKTQ